MGKEEKEHIVPHCVQCEKEMPYGTDGDKFVSVCSNHECSNFGLLQIGVEKMMRFLKYDENYIKGLRQKVRDAGTWKDVDVQAYMDEVRGR